MTVLPACTGSNSRALAPPSTPQRLVHLPGLLSQGRCRAGPRQAGGRGRQASVGKRRPVIAMATPQTIALDAKTNAQPARDRDLVFFTHTLCPYAQRVMLVLLEKELDFELVHVDLSAKPTWYRKVNPRGLVPAVEFTDTGNVEVESIDLCRLLDAKFTGKRSLSPAEGSDAFRKMDRLINSCDRVVGAGLDMASGQDGRYWGIGTRVSEQQVNSYRAALKPLADALTDSGGPFLMGENISQADVIIFPFVERFDIVASGMFGRDSCAVTGDVIQTWLEAMKKRPAVSKASADPDLLLQAYQKHRCLDFFDYTTYGAADLHPQNRE